MVFNIIQVIPATDGTTTVVVGDAGANPGSGPTYTPDPAINDGEDTTFW